MNTSPRVVDSGRVPKGGGVYKVGNPYQVAGRWYTPRAEPTYNQTGVASWYGPGFHGRKTSNGEVFDMHALTAAHKTLPMPSYAYVTNLENGRTILVRINDRGPYVDDRIIDLSKASAEALGYFGAGLSRVRVRYAGDAPLDGDDERERQYLASQSHGGFGRNVVWTPAPSRSVAFREADPPPSNGSAWSPFTHRYGLRSSQANGRSGLGGPPIAAE
ncbi:MAG: septal ring lytic transglycosylase RlpA family protein [Hyphomicrobium sp.]